MSRRAVLGAAVATTAAALAAAIVLSTGGEDERSSGRGHEDRRPPVPREVSRLPGRVPPPVLGRDAPLGARLVRRTQLRDRPGGRVVRALGPRTGFGSQRVLAVIGYRGPWLAVLSHHLPNSRAGWIPADSAELLREPYTLHADLSERRLVVRRRDRVVRRIRVAVGRAATPTPTGRFAVTDALRLIGRGSAYGCCALALTGRQRRVPQGWTGGDRLAIHGTSSPASIGTAASGGCLRAADADMRWLLSRIPLGAPLEIRA